MVVGFIWEDFAIVGHDGKYSKADSTFKIVHVHIKLAELRSFDLGTHTVATVFTEEHKIKKNLI